MQIHHGKHHQAYINNLSATLEGLDDLAVLLVEDLLRNIDRVPEAKRQAVINNGGDHANHSFFWTILSPNDGEPLDELLAAFDAAFGAGEATKEAFMTAATTRFRSGWVWMVVDESGGLQIYFTDNQDSPLMRGHTPMLGVDVWEHAYYLKYQNLRTDYVEAFGNVINWAENVPLAAGGNDSLPCPGGAKVGGNFCRAVLGTMSNWTGQGRSCKETWG
jgi:Fe-Mn family superoxide dismutase